MPPTEPESGEFRRSDKERLWWLEKNIKQLLLDHSTLVQAVEQLKKTVRTLEDFKLRFDTAILLLKFVGLANAANILGWGYVLFYRMVNGKFPWQ